MALDRNGAVREARDHWDAIYSEPKPVGLDEEPT